MNQDRFQIADLARDRTLALMLALGFSSGLPFLLVLGTQALRVARGRRAHRDGRPPELGGALPIR